MNIVFFSAAMKEKDPFVRLSFSRPKYAELRRVRRAREDYPKMSIGQSFASVNVNCGLLDSIERTVERSALAA